MKKFVMMLIMVLGLSAAAMANDTYSHDPSVLPQPARNMLAKNFKAKVSVIKIDKTLGRVDDYEVVLTDGTEISFDRQGAWDNIETANTGAVPSALVPLAIRKHVSKNYLSVRIVGIDKERRGYDIELSNGVDLKFDKAGNFVGYDD